MSREIRPLARGAFDRFLGVLALSASFVFAGQVAADPLDILGIAPEPDVRILALFRERAAPADPGHQQFHDYGEIRRFMFTQLDNHDGMVEGVYSGRKLRTNTVPDAGNMNVEHTWAQSWFRATLPPGEQTYAKCDLHHLYPEDSKLNALRGNLPFGEVQSSPALPGGSRCDGRQFEPRDSVKGDVARGLLYFAARYHVPVPGNQGAIIKLWHHQDPVSAQEVHREQAIHQFQGNHNPFVLNPDLVDQALDL